MHLLLCLLLKIQDFLFQTFYACNEESTIFGCSLYTFCCMRRFVLSWGGLCEEVCIILSNAEDLWLQAVVLLIINLVQWIRLFSQPADLHFT